MKEKHYGSFELLEQHTDTDKVVTEQNIDDAMNKQDVQLLYKAIR